MTNNSSFLRSTAPILRKAVYAKGTGCNASDVYADMRECTDRKRLPGLLDIDGEVGTALAAQFANQPRIHTYELAAGIQRQTRPAVAMLLGKGAQKEQALVVLLHAVLFYLAHDQLPNLRQGLRGVLRQQLLQAREA